MLNLFSPERPARCTLHRDFFPFFRIAIEKLLMKKEQIVKSKIKCAQRGDFMAGENMGSGWITAVLVTVVLILVFLVFFSNKRGNPVVEPETATIKQQEQNQHLENLPPSTPPPRQ
jgi:hypothetical protein